MTKNKRKDDIPEVTPEMIEAGESAYYAIDRYPGDHPVNDEILAAIYRAMSAARGPSRSSA